MSDAADLVQEITGESGIAALSPGAAYEAALLSLFSEAAYQQDQSLTDALDASGFAPLSLPGLTDGTYENQNAAFDVWTSEVQEGVLILAFRGSDDFNDAQGFLTGLTGSADVAGWTNTQAYYDLLAPGIAAVDAYVASNDVSLVYVTGHSLGGATAASYLQEHQNADGTAYLGVTFGAPGILTPGDIDLSAGFPPFTEQYYLETAQAQYTADPRLTMFVIDEDPAAYFGVKTGAVEINYDLNPQVGETTFDLAAFLQDPQSLTAYHDIALYESSAMNYGDLLSGQTTASSATVTVTTALFGDSFSGVLAFAS